jgi:ABC-type lipoprotein release transport system permease subunit
LRRRIQELPEALAVDEIPTITAMVLRQNDLVLFRVDLYKIVDIVATGPYEMDIKLAVLIEAVEE